MLGINAPRASGQIVEAKVVATGMACPFCAYGVEKWLGRVHGVTDVTVDLKTDTANLRFAKGASLDAKAIHRAVTKAGFTMGAVTVTAVGFLTEENGSLVLTVRGAKQKFLLTSPENEKALTKLLKEEAAIQVTGKVQARQQGLARLALAHYAVVK